jgi:hypothetical protein
MIRREGFYVVVKVEMLPREEEMARTTSEAKGRSTSITQIMQP